MLGYKPKWVDYRLKLFWLERERRGRPRIANVWHTVLPRSSVSVVCCVLCATPSQIVSGLLMGRYRIPSVYYIKYSVVFNKWTFFESFGIINFYGVNLVFYWCSCLLWDSFINVFSFNLFHLMTVLTITFTSFSFFDVTVFFLSELSEDLLMLLPVTWRTRLVFVLKLSICSFSISVVPSCFPFRRYRLAFLFRHYWMLSTFTNLWPQGFVFNSFSSP